MGSRGNVAAHPSASFSATLRAHLDDRPGAFADLARAIADAGGLLGAIDLVRVERGKKVRDVTVLAGDADRIDRIVAAARAVPGVEVDQVSERTFLMHLGGKIEVMPKTPLKARDDLSMAYTPEVARVSVAIGGPAARLEPDDQEEHRGGRPRTGRRYLVSTSARRRRCR